MAKPSNPPPSEIFDALLNEGSKRYQTITRKDRNLYGREHGASDLLAYALYMDRSFQEARHIKLIIKYLTKLAKGEIKRLMINMPPRHGKSTIGSMIFPTWWIGNNPASSVIFCSATALLAQRLTRSMRNACATAEYRKIFPDFAISKDQREKLHWVTEAGGEIIGAGIKGMITGFGADLGIIDDPVKNLESARSEAMKEDAWDWYRSTFYTRLHPDAPLLFIGTRWSLDDLGGRILDQDGSTEEGGAWTLLRLPAINAKGEALWPDKWPVHMLQKMRESLGESHFQALYQQEPVELQEKIFSNPQFAEADSRMKTFAYLDPAFGGGDFCSLAIGGLYGEGAEQLAFVRAGSLWKSQIDETYSRVTKLCKEYGVITLGIEANQAQTVLSYEFRKRGLVVKEIKNTTNKHLRIINAVKVNWDKIRFSRHVQTEFLNQILNYHETALHDDAPDALAGLIDILGFGKANLNNRYSWLSVLGRIV